MSWQEWYQDVYLQSEHWLSFRTYILSRQPLCQSCKSPYSLEVHHRNYRCLWNETSDDVAVLCTRCHNLISGEPPWLWRLAEQLVRWLPEIGARKKPSRGLQPKKGQDKIPHICKVVALSAQWHGQPKCRGVDQLC